MTTTKQPLIVDLDGTLIKLDTLFQALFILLRHKPVTLFKIPLWLLKGRAHLKEQILSRVELDPATLPYHTGFLNFLKQERADGRRLILATAANRRTANQVAGHLNLFEDILASDEQTNLKGIEKLKAIQKGHSHFAYAGNSTADFPIWEAADEIILVNPDAASRRAYGSRAAQTFEDRPPILKLILKAIRAHQWLKNLLIFAPLVLSHKLGDLQALSQSLLAFLSFSLAASTIYLLNDLFDLAADQHHPRKCQRPFASGNLSISTGIILVPLLAAGSILLAHALPLRFTGLLLIYFLTTTLYSIQLKQLVVVDVLTLAILYTLRILAGGWATGIHVSSWLTDFSIFFFLSLALVKRMAELRELKLAGDNAVAARERGYGIDHLPILLSFGAVSGYISIFVFTRYMHSDKVIELYSRPDALWMLTPLLLYWVTRIWMLAWEGKMKDDPVAFAATDLQTCLLGLLGLAIMLYAM
jgi:4-hydroxybenzoate polyprenyltransferase